MSTASDRNVLLGLMALREELVERQALIEAMACWAESPDESLAAVLAERGLLDSVQQARLEEAVARQLKEQGGVPECIAAFGAEPLLGELLDPATDVKLASSLVPLADTLVRGSKSEGPPLVGSSTRQGGRFRVLRRHAGGGLGEVFLAEDEELHREVALKEIRTGYADDDELRARFVLEAEITGRLEHPGIVPVYGLGRYDDGRPFYAMRMIRGDSLQIAIDRFHRDGVAKQTAGALAFRKLLGQLIDVCDAVAYAHSRGVIHRDIKPENVMLGPYGETLLVDWGLAKLVVREEERGETSEADPNGSRPARSTLHPVAEGSSPTQVGLAIGTPAYMSPEQAAGLVDQLGPACDVYCLGATLYAILTGGPPFSGARLEELRHAVMIGRFPSPRKQNPSVPPALESICLKAMALDPAKRYATARHLAADIEAYLADEPVGAWREPVTVRAGRWMRRHRTAVTGGMAAMLVAVVSLAVGVLLLSAANEDVRRAKTEAEQGREEAQEYFHVAQGAVDRYLTHVSGDPRLRSRGLEPLRRDLLGTASEFYEQLVERRPDDPQLEWERGRAYFRLASITAEVGSRQRAVEFLGDARGIFESLTQRFPDRPAYRASLAKAHINLALLHRETGQTDEARAELIVAKEIGERLTADYPDEPDYQVDLANVHANLAALDVADKAFDAAETSYQAALAIRVRLVDKHPDVAEYRYELAGNQSNLGLLYHLGGRRQEAEQALASARDVQQSLVDEHSEVPHYQSDLATTWHRLAVLYAEMPEGFAEAEAAHRAALEVRERLATEHPEVTQYAQELARSHNNLATLYCTHGRFEEAEAGYLTARRIHRRLVDGHADIPEHRNDLGATLSNLANLYSDTMRAEEAESAYREAIQLRQRLVAEFPETADYRSALAIAYNNLATLLTLTERLDEAEVAFRASIRIREQLRLRYPSLAFDLGTTYANVAHLQRELGQLQASLSSGQKAVEILEAGPPGTQNYPTVRDGLRNAHWACAAALGELGRHDETLLHWDKAVALATGPAAMRLKFARATSLARAGEHARATAEARQLQDAAADDPEALYRLAAIWSLSARAAGEDTTLEPDERMSLAAKHVAAAIDALRAAAAAGFFADESSVARLDEDPDIEPLRNEEGFRQLIGELQGGGP